MSDPFSSKPFPRTALLGAAALICLTLVAAFLSRPSSLTAPEPPQGAIAQSLDLRFEDWSDGSVGVIEPASDEVIGVVDPGGGGFVRGVLRGMGRERKLRGMGPEAPYRLTRWSDGRLSLSDPATGVRIDLEPFGPANVAAFAVFLSPDAAQSLRGSAVSMQ